MYIFTFTLSCNQAIPIKALVKMSRFQHQFPMTNRGRVSRGKSGVFEEYLPTICSSHEYLPSFHGEATNIEETNTIMNQNMQDFLGISTTFYSLRRSCYASSTHLPGTNYDNTRRFDNYRRLWTIIDD